MYDILLDKFKYTLIGKRLKNEHKEHMKIFRTFAGKKCNSKLTESKSSS